MDAGFVNSVITVINARRLELQQNCLGKRRGRTGRMNQMEIFRLECKNPSISVIESLYDSQINYLYDPERRGIIITGKKGMVGLTIEQARAVADELPAILDTIGGV